MSCLTNICCKTVFFFYVLAKHQLIRVCVCVCVLLPCDLHSRIKVEGSHGLGHLHTTHVLGTQNKTQLLTDSDVN